MTSSLNLTPMLRQYLEIKDQNPNSILFYRMGDFYEMFFEDAHTASKILNITLTSRNNKGDANKVPMCGIPYHAAQSYIGKLVKAGKRVAICEQVEDPATAKGIVKREVIRVISPGVVTDDHILDEKENRYVCSIFRATKKEGYSWAISFLDLSTGEFLVGEFIDNSETPEQILDQISRLNPAEILFNTEDISILQALIKALLQYQPEICITERPPEIFHFDVSFNLLIDHFNVVSLDGFGCQGMREGIIAAASLLEYITETQKTDFSHIERIKPIDINSVMIIDDSSRRNLELTQTLIGSKRDGSLLSVLDKTCTPMGARLLKNYLLAPLQDSGVIKERLNGVTLLFEKNNIRIQLREALSAIYDMERLNSRMVLGHGNGRDALSLKNSFSRLPDILRLIENCDAPVMSHLTSQFDNLDDLHQLLEAAISDDPPITLRDGNLIKNGYNKELDELIHLLRDGKQLILDLENDERAKTGIPKLKIGYNKIFGYFIEISKANIDKVPDHYIRKQTLVNAERFITPELKEFEGKVLSAQERRLELEYQLFMSIRNILASNSGRLVKMAHVLAQIDVLCCFAEIAHRYHYKCPDITENGEIIISEGRHPIIERALPAGRFVPNDVLLDQDKNQLLILTGPNMAGKSTVLRLTAIIVLMAQMGSFVPAEKASIGIVDRIFTRVGAMDDLRRGQSTFMVEMSETANILNNATTRSLVILDEIGRGTSTYDGLSIAWAVAEALVNKDDLGIKTMFATHYHELTDLAKNHTRVQNMSISVKEWNDTIIFLHKLVAGGTNRSYGIQVAALAGVPSSVVKRAEEILKKIEHGELDYQSGGMNAPPKKNSKNRTPQGPCQLSLFPEKKHPAMELIQNLDIDDITPRKALELLYHLKEISG